MHSLKSPWTYQLQRTRPLQTLNHDIESDICVVGGGIAGIMSAYYILKYTDNKIVILEATQVANGATGHNAGQLVSDLERPIVSMVKEYGMDKTIAGLQSIDSAWIMLEEIIRDANLDLPYSTFIGYDVYTTKTQVLRQLEDLVLAHQGGLHSRKIYISKEHVSELHIPSMYDPYYELVPHDSILSLAETINPQYIAAFPLRKGCLNSAVLTEQLATFLTETYGESRFNIYEKTPVSEVDLHKSSAVLRTVDEKTIKTKKILLCTNGFENFVIKDRHNDINMDFHKNVKGNIGYMMARTENVDHNPSANAYLEPAYDNRVDGHSHTDRDIVYANEYVYSTRRPYDLGQEEPKNLFCIGGRGTIIEDTSGYGKEIVYQADIRDQYLKFITENFAPAKLDDDHQEFIWHGLMGYTANGLRMVGFEPRNQTLMYNLGCNGIGILPSIWGGKRIASLLNGDTSTSLFDPK